MEKVLIIDDEVDICYFLTKNLNRKNYFASYVNNLKDARLAFDKQQPSILLLDNHLPDGLGLDFAQEVKLNHPEIRIVMFTAHDTPKDQSIAINRGVDYFLSKPFMMTQIFEAIKNVKKND